MQKEELLSSLREYMVRNPVSIRALSKEIGVDRITLDRFLKGNEISLKIQLTIERFLQEK